MSRFTAVLLAAALATVVGGGGIARAGQSVVYEWTDAHGEVHYTDQWVPGAKRIAIQTAHGPADSGAMQGIQDESNAASKEIEQQAAARAVQKDEARIRAKECKAAKSNYETLIHSRRIFTVDKSGQRHYFSDAKANAIRVKARETMQTDCGSGS
jgi:hypothetical protein